MPEIPSNPEESNAASPPTAGKTSDSSQESHLPSNAKGQLGWYARLSMWLRKTFQSDLMRYRSREELTWATESPQLLNLAWLLRMQHAEARQRANRTALAGTLITLAAVLMAGTGVGAAIYGWHHLSTYIVRVPEPTLLDPLHLLTSNVKRIIIPDRLWEIAIATSALVLLIAGFSTLLFNVAKGYHQRYLSHVREMQITRRIEAAIRITMSHGAITDPEVKTAFSKLAERFIDFPKSESNAEDADISAMPEIVKACKELFEAVTKAAKTSKG